jgi:hypothetical protein
MERRVGAGIIALMFGLVSGCMTTNTPKPEDTTLHKTWSNAFLIEMGNSIVNDDFTSYVFYMSEYEDSLAEENERTLKFLREGEDLTRYGDTEHEYYVTMTMKMCAMDTAAAYFYFTRYLKLMETRFLYNMDWKPIPDYAK